VYTRLNEIVDSGKCESILFCGHSLGSAMSALSAFDYANARDIPVSVVTFGSPRVGNKSFAADFDTKIPSCLRIVNDLDLVPLAPFRFLEYCHVGSPVQLKEDEVEVVLGDVGVFTRLRLRVRGLFGLDFGVSDHSMDKYIEEIEKHLGA
jgi:hypothetical protein